MGQHMETQLVGKFHLGDGWQCECGKVFFLSGEFYEEHWSQQLNFHCSRCGTKYSLCEGELHKKIEVPEFAESPF